MFAFIFIFIFLLAGETVQADSSSGLTHTWNTYFNYPGFELWKFINLAVFIAILVYLLRKPVSEAFKAKRELIRAELIRAEAEKQAALAQLTATETKVAQLATESETVRERAAQEAAAEKERVAEQTAAELAKLRAQAQSEIARTNQQAKIELRKFSAEESIRRAEELIKQNINETADARLIKAGIQSIGGLR